MGTRRRTKESEPFELWPAERVMEGVTVAPRYPESAARALAIFKALRVPDLPDRPRLGDACRPWAFNFVAELFGGLNPETREQTIREAFLLISKKNTKTLVGGGVLLTALLTHERENDECALMISATKEVASLAFNTIAGMVRCDDALDARIWVRDNIKALFDRDTSNTAAVVALDSNALAGKRAAFTLIDELHLLGKLPRADAALQEAQGAQASRAEGFIASLTTQSAEPPAGVFLDRLSYARKVHSGEIKDPAFLACMYEPEPGFVPTTDAEFLQAVKASNPNLGVSVSEAWLLQQWHRVKDKRDGSKQTFLAKHANVEIGQQLRRDGWAGAEFWDKAETDLTLDQLIDRCEVIEIGADGGGLDDLLGVYVLGRESGTRNKLGWAHAFCNPVVLQRRPEIAPRLRDFEAAGELEIVETGEDVARFVQLVEKIRATGKLHKICVDGFALGGIPESLMAAGMDRDTFATVAQGFRQSPNVQACERWLASGELFVAKQALMRWCVGNARIVPKGNGVQVDKAVSGKAKIDPLISLFNATFELAKNPPAMGKRKLIFFTLE